MAEAARDLSKQEQEAPRSESERAKPELRVVTEEEAPSLIDRMVEEFQEGAEAGTQEMRQDGKALEDFASDKGGLSAEESRTNADITSRAEAAADRLRTDLAANDTAPDAVATAEANMRALEAQYKDAPADQKRALERHMEAASKELDEARAAARKAKAEAAPAAAKAEAKVVPDFGQLLAHLAPEAQAAAARNFAEADETSYGGLVSKQMTPDGVVRVGYKDGTIVETFPGGQKRSNLPDATGAERIPELPAYLQEAQPMYDASGEVGLLTLEEDMLQSQEELYRLESGQGVPGSEARRAELRANIGEMSEKIKAKSTPDGLAKEVADMRSLIAAEEADMNLAPEEERGAYATRIEHWQSQAAELEGRLAASKAKEAAPEAPAAVAQEVPAAAAAAEAQKGETAVDRKDRMVKLEARLRELEAARKDAATPEDKRAIDQQLEASTKEWEALKNAWTPEDEAAYQEAQAEKAKKERLLALEGRMRELEQQYKEAGDPDKKAAIARDLEAATREWDALRREPVSKKEAPKAASKAVESAAALVAAAETMAAAAEVIADTTEKQAEKQEAMDKAKEAEKSALRGLGGYAGEHYTGGGGGGSSGGGGGYGGGGGGKERTPLGKRLEAAWDWAQKFFGGWTGVK